MLSSDFKCNMPKPLSAHRTESRPQALKHTAMKEFIVPTRARSKVNKWVSQCSQALIKGLETTTEIKIPHDIQTGSSPKIKICHYCPLSATNSPTKTML